MNHKLSFYRSFFPILEDKIQLSSCSQSAISTRVSHAINEYTESLKSGGMDWELWMSKVNDAKKGFAQIIGAESDEIAIMASVSDIISSIITALPYKNNKNRILTTEIDFPSIAHVLLAQEKHDAVVEYIPSIDHKIPLEYYEQYIKPETLITCVSHVSYYNGFTQDLKSIAQIAHRKGSLLFVDAYQSAGNVPIDVKEMGIDILATGAQKYLLGIPGIAFLYIRKELANELWPRVTGWFGQENPFAFDNRNLIYATGTRRFETGTPPVINAYAAAAAFDLLLEVGITNITDYLKELSKLTIDYIKEKGLTMVSPLNLQEKSATTSIYVGDGNKIEKIMKEKGFIVSARKDVIRIAPHFYNSMNDIKLAVDELALLKEV